MTYYINPIWFYLMNVCENLGALSMLKGDDEIVNLLTKYVKPSAIVAIVFIFLACAIPSKETFEEMMIASVVTHENVDQAKDDVKSIVDYVFDRIENNDSEE